MKIKLFSLFCLFITSFSVTQITNALDHKLVIAWDLHDTIVQKPIKKMIRYIYTAIKNSNNKLDFIKLIVNPYFWYDVHQFRNQCNITEEWINLLMKKYPFLQAYTEQILEFINMHEPISEVVALLKNLKQQGHRHYLASNIGSRSFAVISKKLPDLFALFDGVYIPDQYDSTTNKIIAKPCPTYFVLLRNFLTQQGIDSSTPVILIDDRKENINAANTSTNFYGILFNNAEQLRHDIDAMITQLKSCPTTKELYA